MHTFNNNSNCNANERNINNHNRLRGIAQPAEFFLAMSKPRDLWQALCDLENLKEAYRKARRHKTQKSSVLAFEKEGIMQKLRLLRTELLLHAYRPKLLETFILRDPKTRKISKSDFRDRIVHHAFCNIIEPIFDETFIFDSYANRKGKGTLKAVERFISFQKHLAQNQTRPVFVLKADVRHYFDAVDHTILLTLLKKKIADARILWLVRKILGNYKTKPGKGMPLGNLTSQFFANVYLNELDQFVKHRLKARYYLRYVDDFVILHHSRWQLESYQQHIQQFLDEKLKLTFHPDKSRILSMHCGVEFLGFKIFLYHKLLKKRNFHTFYRKLYSHYSNYEKGSIDYDTIYNALEGWCAYARQANTYRLRQRILQKVIEEKFPHELSEKEMNRLKKIHGEKKR